MSAYRRGGGIHERRFMAESTSSPIELGYLS